MSVFGVYYVTGCTDKNWKLFTTVEGSKEGTRYMHALHETLKTKFRTPATCTMRGHVMDKVPLETAHLATGRIG